MKNKPSIKLNYVRMPVPDTDYELVRLISVTREAINKTRQKELNRIGIHGRRSAIFLAIDILGEKATPTAIADLLFRKRHTISDLLTRMDAEGIIQKVYDLKKKNMVRPVFTEKGRSIAQKTNTRESIQRIFSILPSAEQKKLYSILLKIRNGLIMNEYPNRMKTMIDTGDAVFNLYILFTEATDLMRAARRIELDERKIQPSRSAFLLSIQSLGERATPSLLARQLIREPHSVSEMLAKMQDEGIISRRTNPEKKSSTIISLTEKGHQIYGTLLLGLAHRKTMALITIEERQQLKTSMEKLLDKAMQVLHNS